MSNRMGRIVVMAMLLISASSISAESPKKVVRSGVEFEVLGYGGTLCRVLVQNETGTRAYLTCGRQDGGTFNKDYCNQWVEYYGPVISQDVADRLDIGFENGELVYKNPDGKGDVNIFTLDSMKNRPDADSEATPE